MAYQISHRGAEAQSRLSLALPLRRLFEAARLILHRNSLS